MSRHQRKIQWAIPKALPEWVIGWEVWKDDQPYRKGKMRIPAKTEQDARQSVQYILDELLPNLFPGGDVRLTSELTCEMP